MKNEEFKKVIEGIQGKLGKEVYDTEPSYEGSDQADK